MVNVLTFATLIAATYAVEQCDNYGSGDNKYWEEAAETLNGVDSKYCRLVYCVKRTNSDTNTFYGEVENYWRLDTEASESEIQQKCGITCNFADFVADATCGCPSCPTITTTAAGCTDETFTCPDGTQISRNENCEFEKDTCCTKTCGDSDGTVLQGALKQGSDNGDYCEYVDEHGIALSCPHDPTTTATSVNCPTDTYECLDKTLLTNRDDATCKFVCPDTGCNTKVCCDGTLYESECVALMHECSGSNQLEAGPVAVCTDDVMTCPSDGTTDITDISRNECCAFDEDTCCIKTCNGVTYNGYYYANDADTGSATCKYKNEHYEYIETPCQTAGCTDDTYTCIDSTVLPARDDTDCKFPCPDKGCDTKVCCDGEVYDKECEAQRECDVTMIAYPPACTDDVFDCPDSTTISRNECCQFEKDDCCIKQCEDGTKMYGVYYSNDDGTEGCKYENECGSCTDDTFLCPDGTKISRGDNCEFDEDSCCIKYCDDAATKTIQGEYYENDDGTDGCKYDTECITTTTKTETTTTTTTATEPGGCTDDIHTCSDGTVLSTRLSDEDCNWECPTDGGCDDKKCCDGQVMTECEAINECDVATGFTDPDVSDPSECPDVGDDAGLCSDGETHKSRNVCCGFDDDHCPDPKAGKANQYGVMIGIGFVITIFWWM